MRRLLPFFLIVATGLVFIFRLFYLQVVDDSFVMLSEDNAVKVVYDYPQRGYIFDRNGELIVSNQPSYDVMVIPNDLKPFDTLEFCSLLSITKEDLEKELSKAKNYSPRLPSPVVPQLTKAEYAFLQEKMRKYEGFFIQKRALRDYKTANAANILGYIAEVNNAEIKKDNYYLPGELIGKQGLEQQYEEVLRGKKGVRRIQKDRFNRDIGPYKDGVFDTLPQKGKDLTITIDLALQAYAEKLMVNKRGGIVAIEPASGEILSLVSAPTYDPALLVGRKKSPNYTRMHYDTLSRPLFDRSLTGEYVPGSPFKTLTGLIALEENVINTKERFSCRYGYRYGRGANAVMGCHQHPQPLSLVPGVAHSCNAYFAQTYRRVIEKYTTPQKGIDVWKKHLNSFGLGQFLGYDLPIGRRGLIPGSGYYDRAYPNHNWFATATLSNAIGQGEVILTPIQMANMTAAIANKGWFYTPHLLKTVDGKPITNPGFTKKNFTTISPEHFEPIIQGMHDVYNYGTAEFLQVPGIEICGKTGTSENFTIIDGKRQQLTDHSVFVAFAPKDNPKIAVSIIVEHGYWGARYAGRIASLIIEKYLRGTITRTDLEQWVLTHSLEEEYAKPYSGEPFKINQ
ncbi:penicillin-binding protein 2 [Gangjinia marincola]|uniref:Penicillin-binding protein 2 n=1 Tax=Gangjinia marincola TaxID=578463 RepID=A0ABP3XVV5_9FLAO